MLSIPHLIIIFVIALVIFGPDKLPELARNLGKLMAEFRRTTNDLRGTFETHLRDLEREADIRRIDAPRQTTTTPAAQTTPEITAAQGTVPASAPYNAALAAGSTPTVETPDPAAIFENPMYPEMYTEDPQDLIRQAEEQIARERAAEEAIERVNDGGAGKS